MQLPVQIVSRDHHLSKHLEATILEKAHKLDTFYGRITRCRVVVESQTHHHAKDYAFKVRVDLRVPGAELVADHHEHADLKLAIRHAFEAARRRLQDYAHQLRHDARGHDVKVREMKTDPALAAAGQ